MKILVANDDGVYAPGIAILARTLSTIAEVVVVAPDRNRSGASNSLTLDRPLRVKQLENGFYSVEGTPTDCVHLASTGLLAEPPDMVVAGINAGSNLGDDVLYSGTVAAAIEGRFLGLPAIAISLVGDMCQYYATAAHFAKLLVISLRDNPLSSGIILNINVPDVPLDQINGIKTTRLGARHKAENIVEMQDPRGKTIYWVGAAGQEADAGDGTDFNAINNNFVALTPLLIDLTHHKALQQIAGWTDGLTI